MASDPSLPSGSHSNRQASSSHRRGSWRGRGRGYRGGRGGSGNACMRQSGQTTNSNLSTRDSLSQLIQNDTQDSLQSQEWPRMGGHSGNVRTQSCPYQSWSFFFPAESYDATHPYMPLIPEMIEFFVQYYEERYDPENKEGAERLLTNKVIHVDYDDILYNVESITIESAFEENPVFVLGCLNVAVSEANLRVCQRLQSEVGRLLLDDEWKRVRLRHYGTFTPLKDLKANLMGKFISIKGTVVRASSIKPLVTQLSFKCPDCDTIQTLTLHDGKYRAPSSCTKFGCKGRRFLPVRKNDSETKTIDWQRIRVQEKLANDQMDAGRVPRTVECEVTNDLVDVVVPGDVVTITGFVKVLATDDSKGRGNSAQMYYLYIDVHSVLKAGNSSADQYVGEIGTGLSKDHMSFTKKELFGIREISTFGPDTFRLLVNSLCPAIFGHELVKAGLLLTLLGGRRRGGPGNEVSIRSDPHILIVGDPGLGKSQMLGATCKLAPRGVYVCGNTTTTSGLTVTVCKDPDTGDTALEAGALILGDQGICCIDEFDKMTEHQALLEAMEQQSVSIAKAGLVCSLPARTSIIAAANPVGGHYNKSKTVAENLKLNSALLSRFDLVFILLDKPNERMDRFLADHIMKLHSGGLGSRSQASTLTQQNRDPLGVDVPSSIGLAERLKFLPEEAFEPVPTSLLRKYIAYTRMHVQPRLTQEAADVLQKFYLTLRAKYRSIDSTPITTRQLESMVRLAEARARVELRENVTAEDANDVIDLMKFSLWETYEDEAGVIDFARSQLGTGMSQKKEPKRFISELRRLAQQTGNNVFQYDHLYRFAQEIGMKCDKFGDMIESLNLQGSETSRRAK